MTYTRDKNDTKQQIQLSVEATQGQCITSVQPGMTYEVE
ncbi:MAG: hypothetical protein ACI9LE_000670 [Paraglaciecola sp.]|jgi:hypothetical protein